MAGKKPLLIASGSAFVGASLSTFVALRMLADNNNQGELFDSVTGRSDISYAVTAAAVLYSVSFLIIFALAFGLAWLWGRDTNPS